MDKYHDIPWLERSAESIIDAALPGNGRLLLFGEAGAGKSTLALELERAMRMKGRNSFVLSADPGSPSFGLPGAVSLARHGDDGWTIAGMEALCSLDAARFRMPLVSAVGRLARKVASAPLILDAPGVVRGVAGAELLLGLAEAAGVDAVLMLVRKGEPPRLMDELRSTSAKLFFVEAAAEAHSPTRRLRERSRTKLWDEYLGGTQERVFDIASTNLLGTPPPLDVRDAWPGRQAALLDDGQNTMAFAEVTALGKEHIRVRTPPLQKEPSALLIRDAQRNSRGFLGTARLLEKEAVRYAPPPDMCSPPEYAHVTGPRPTGHVGTATATLVNGVFGDPLLHLRMRREKRSILFDLGEAGRLPARIAHQVSDVFISHAHIDHIGGFVWLLRSRIGYLPTCRIFGPPGLSENILGMVRGILWDRIGDSGPRFEVSELHGDRLLTRMIEAGRDEAGPVGERPIKEGVVLEEKDFLVRAVTLDHRTPVLAFAFEAAMRINVRKEALARKGWAPGPWLGELKNRVYDNDREAAITTPDGGRESAGRLADELFLITPGEKLAYAVDFGNSPENRRLVGRLAASADAFFCEAAFAEADADMAEKYQHMTARACGETANAAGVGRLIPFHHSKRYEKEPERIYQEIRAVCSRVAVPKFPG